ncbi:putative hydrolase [Fusobacterium varium]|nr:putative hydrolase [Fusobacterium varium]
MEKYDEIKRAAKAIENEIIENRRYIHEYPEIGLELARTSAFVKQKLFEMGYEIEEICKCGVLAKIGKLGKTLLIRADMDALPMAEINDLPFKSKNDYGHTCGHDTHIAMLLGAAKLLKQYGNELEGTVLLLFQPGEETLEGAQAVIEGGLLKKYKIDAAIAMHIETVDVQTGHLIYKKGNLYASSDNFNIQVEGKGCHGAYPNEGIDPINILTNIYLSLQSITTREISPMQPFVLSIGSFHGGTVRNVIPDTARMEGTFRTYSNELREFVKLRINEIATKTAEKYGGKCIVEFLPGIPPLVTNSEVTEEMLTYASEIVGRENTRETHQSMGSEDFSVYADEIPSTYFGLGAGSKEEGYLYGGHNPKVQFNEKAFYLGSAIFTNCALKWLKNNK